MWTDFYLKSPDRETFDAALPESGFGPEVVLDVVGLLYPTDTPAGEAPVALDGWHANVRVWDGSLPDALVPFLIEAPLYPKRVWA